MIDESTCSRCGHVPGDILEGTAAILDGAMLAEETERHLAFGELQERAQAVVDEERITGRVNHAEASQIITDYINSGGRAKPLEEEPE